MDFEVIEFDSTSTNLQSNYIELQYSYGWELISVIKNPEFESGVIMYFKKSLSTN